jgi:hypothetical protein
VHSSSSGVKPCYMFDLPGTCSVRNFESADSQGLGGDTPGSYRRIRICSPVTFRRWSLGATPNTRLNALLKAASES